MLGSGWGIGGPVHMWESEGASFRELSEAEVERVAHGVDQWIGIEKDSLSLLSRTGEEWKTESGIVIATSLPPDLESNN
jgi:hypothetical protein